MLSNRTFHIRSVQSTSSGDFIGDQNAKAANSYTKKNMRIEQCSVIEGCKLKLQAIAVARQ